MADIVKDRQLFVDVFARREDIQLLAAVIRVLKADKNLARADCLAMASCELNAMARVDAALQAEAEAETEKDLREIRIRNLMKKVCKTKQ